MIYDMFLECIFDGGEIAEISIEWEGHASLHAGDHVYIDGLEDVQVEKVTWYLDKSDHAFVDLGTVRLAGTKSDWAHLFATQPGT